MIRSVLSRLGAAAVAAACLATPVFADRDYRYSNNHDSYARYGNEAIVFKDPNYRGAGLRIDGPIYNMSKARFNDTISSIDVRGTWEICVDPDFRGKCEIISGSQSRLTHIRMNDNISSMRPVSSRYRYGSYDYGSSRDHRYGNAYRRDAGYDPQTNYAGIVLYRDPNFRGRSIGLERSIPNLQEVGFNDTISSIEVNDGLWLVCEHPDYRGRCEVIDGALRSASAIGMNDKITSIRPYYDRGYRGHH
ncbi:MAG: hypothetical protein Hens3KO_09710 [Henriciella sp.]